MHPFQSDTHELQRQKKDLLQQKEDQQKVIVALKEDFYKICDRLVALRTATEDAEKELQDIEDSLETVQYDLANTPGS